MKYVLIIGDGMADNPVPALEHKTPLQAANIPVMDALAAKGEKVFEVGQLQKRAEGSEKVVIK